MFSSSIVRISPGSWRGGTPRTSKTGSLTGDSNNVSGPTLRSPAAIERSEASSPVPVAEITPIPVIKTDAEFIAIRFQPFVLL